MLLIGTFMLGCKPDPMPEPNPDPEIPTEWSHTFGDVVGMKVIDYDTTAWTSDPDLLMFDVNGDGDADIQFFTYYDGPLAVGKILKLYAKCLNPNVEWYGDIVERNHYQYHSDTTYYFEDPENSIVESVTVNTQITSCAQENEHFVLESTENVFELRANLFGEMFDADADFSNEQVYLHIDDYSIPWGKGVNDTIYYNYGETSVHNNCGRFPIDQPYYIGFRYTENDIQRFGWILLKLNHEAPGWGWKGNYDIRQFAIQE